MVQHIPNMVPNLVNVAGQTVERATLTGLQSASQKSGVSFEYLVAKAAQESSFKTDARAETSSATGLFQFTRGTWLDLMKKFGALYGYGELAQKISVGNDGRPVVNDPLALQRLMALRSNAEASGLMAAAYARDNAATLEHTLGRGVDATDLYLAHFLGPTGASQVLNAAAAKPDTAAAGLLPAAAKANANVFYAADGRARGAAELVKLVRDRFTGQLDRYGDVAAILAGRDAEAAFSAGRAAAGAVIGPVVAPPDFVHPATARAAGAEHDPSKAMIAHFILEELAKLIAAKPMSMNDGSDGDENAADGTSVGATGFQGTDWSTAMTRALTKNDPTAGDQAALERGIAKGRAGEAMRTYDMLNAVPGAPYIPVRRQDPR